jgi:N-methylhydantoinase A
LVARIKFEFSRTVIAALNEGSLQKLNGIFSELEKRGRDALNESHAEKGSQLLRQARMRYVGQGYEISVEIPAKELDVRDLEDVHERFLATYARLYGYADPKEPLEIVDLRLTALGPADGGARLAGESAPRSEPAAGRSRHKAYFPTLGGFVEVQLWNRRELAIGSMITGPGIVREPESTILVPPDFTATVDELRNIRIAPSTDASDSPIGEASERRQVPA